VPFRTKFGTGYDLCHHPNLKPNHFGSLFTQS
jgi:hypothetical protein